MAAQLEKHSFKKNKFYTSVSFNERRKGKKYSKKQERHKTATGQQSTHVSGEKDSKQKNLKFQPKEVEYSFKKLNNKQCLRNGKTMIAKQ